jgi:predicted deacetylase
MTMQRTHAPGDEVRPRVIVSVHDVAPSALSQVRWLLDRLDETGATPRVLKVIPNEGGQRPIGREGELVELLRREAAAGSETVLHGYTHLAAGVPRVGVVDRWRWRLFARSGAEFAALGPAAAAERVVAGRDALAELGLPVVGFCAPGWLGGPGLAEVLRAAGLSYLVSFAWLVDLQRGQRRFLPAFGYLGADDLQEILVATEGGYLLAARSAFPVLRVFLHPQGASTSRSCARALLALERLVRERRPTTYAALLGL